MPKIDKTGGPQLPVRCGQCVHLKDIPAFAEVCNKLGITDYSKPCAKFQANWKMFSYSEPFAQMLKSTLSDDLPNLLALIAAEINTRKAKFKYGMTVFVRLFGEDYISNYAKCQVISAQGRYVYVQGAQADYYGAFLKKSIYNEAQFLKKIMQLAHEQKYRDPKLQKFTNWKPVKRGPLDIKDVPNIDEVFKHQPKQNMSFSVNAFE